MGCPALGTSIGGTLGTRKGGFRGAGSDPFAWFTRCQNSKCQRLDKCVQVGPCGVVNYRFFCAAVDGE